MSNGVTFLLMHIDSTFKNWSCLSGLFYVDGHDCMCMRLCAHVRRRRVFVEDEEVVVMLPYIYVTICDDVSRGSFESKSFA